MAQTATALSTGQSLYITDNNLVAASEKVTESAVVFNNELKFFNGPSVFNYGTRVRYHFEIDNEHTSYFALIRGLIDFSRSSELTFTFNAAAKSFEIDLEAAHNPKLESLILLVSTQLLKEIRFKTKLKEVLAFEARYLHEKAQVYATFL